MSGLFFLSALLGIAYLIRWMIQNDNASRIEDQKGWFSMTVPKDPTVVPASGPGMAKQRDHHARSIAAPRPAPGRPPVRQPRGEVPGPGVEEEIIHPLWQGRRPKHRP